MFCHTADKRIESMASLLILGGLVPLAFAIYVQHWLHLPPCHFCMLQRYPYAVMPFVGLASLMVPRGSLRWRFCVAVGLFALLATGVLGLIHSGIESGFFAYHGGCVASAGGNSAEAILRAITAAPIVSCSDKLAQFMGISMASWNVVFVLFMLVLIALQYRFDMRGRHE